MPRARSSWPSRQLLSARKSTVSYRILGSRKCYTKTFSFMTRSIVSQHSTPRGSQQLAPMAIAMSPLTHKPSESVLSPNLLRQSCQARHWPPEPCERVKEPATPRPCLCYTCVRIRINCLLHAFLPSAGIAIG